MKLSLKVEYACQVLAQLGYTVERKSLPHIEDLAKAESIPSNYLVQILNELRTAGLINSRRGKQGGYVLARPAAEISLHDIMLAVEGTILAHSAPGGGHSSPRVSEIWGRVETDFEKLLKAISVADLMSEDRSTMWYI